MDKSVRLIILRGNSGSGKTTTAKALQQKFGHGTMLISQDVIRREMLYVNDGPNPLAGQLLFDLAMYGKQRCKVVILEGILNADWYDTLFEYLLKEFNDHIYAYYFDIPFAETLKRHHRKPNAQDFGEQEMRRWWNDKDFLDFIPEVCLGEELNLKEIVDTIYHDVKK